MAAARVVVVGIGADGWEGLPARLRALVEDAEVVLGGRRHLALLQKLPGTLPESSPESVPESRPGQLLVPWPSPLRAGLPGLMAGYTGRRVVALATGDPLLSGIGSTLVDLLGPGAVEVHPGISSVALARARTGWSAESTAVVSTVGRDPALVLRELAPGRRVVVLSSDATTPGALARLLVAQGYGASLLSVLGDLGAPTETRLDVVAAAWNAAADARVPPLNVVALDLRGPVVGSWTAGLPDEAYEHDGQLTKRDLRASALARLTPQPGHLLWDLGAGAGSVGIEWLRAHPTCRAVAVEADPARAERIVRNAHRLGVPGLDVRTGRAEEVLATLPADVAHPDAVFVGGGATAPGLLDRCREALTARGPGGRLVVHGVTLETETVLVRAHAEHGGELTRTSVERAAPIGSFRGWDPARAVTQWAWSVPGPAPDLVDQQPPADHHQEHQ